jgi:hypothetical protein
MKKIRLVMSLIMVNGMVSALPYRPGDEYAILIEPTWRMLDPDDSYVQTVGGQWVLVGSFTFKKRSQETVHLNKLILQWHGPTITKLVGELYSKRSDRDFLPIEEYLVSDGMWCKTNQELVLDFRYSLTLGPISEFFLVLTLPKEVQELVKQGTFDLSLRALPIQFRQALDETQVSLSLRVPVAEIRADTRS